MPPKKSKSPAKAKKAPSVDPVVTNTDKDDANLANRYQKVSHVDHILLRPEMYVGSIENHISNMWVFAEGAERVHLPNLLPPGVFEQKLVELKKNTVKLTKSSASKKDDVEGEGEGAIDAEVSLDDNDLDTVEDEIEEVNGVDARLLASENAIQAFPPGSQRVEKVFINPGLIKIVDEIVVNAADNRLVPSKTKQTYIKVTFDEASGEITVQNDGAAIPIALHPEHQVYVPEMIFGSLLTSSHYGNDPNSIAAGRHGFGAKLTNILSSTFSVECVKDGKRFIGKWSDNMKSKDSVHVDNSFAGYDGDYTKVSFVPEYDRFVRADRAKVDDDASSSYLPENFNIVAELGKILKRRLLDLSASIGSSLEIYYNDELLTPTDFTEYVRMHMPEGDIARQPFVQSTRHHTGTALACDYACVFIPPPKAGEGHLHHHVSLVNGIVTHQGGTHLRFLTNAFDEALTAAASLLEKEERLILNIPLLKQSTTLFVNVLVHQSKFDSQSKDRLVSKHTFAPVKISDLTRHILLLPFIRSFCMTSDKMTAALEGALASMSRQKNLMRMIPKLVEPADMTIPMHRTLILTEGDSAKALALNSLSAEQRQSFGVLPLRGKMLNVRTAHPRKIAANKEIIHVLATLGLSTKEKYKDGAKLRYQRILIMTDQDYDGFHIRGLIVSLINYYWPELMRAIPDYVSIFSTPLIKVRNQGKLTSFYCIADYQKWLKDQDPATIKNMKVKYYKGLGTSTTDEGREYFKEMDNNIRSIEATDPVADAELMDKTFGAGDQNILWRKNWVLQSKMVADMESGRGTLTIPSFVNQQLVQYAMADNLRSFPDIRDGLRSSHRKIIWAMLNRKSSETLRVSQCAGYVSETTNYHHGEASLISAIVGLAQSFVGSNNVPLLLGEGQFGSRINGGRDSAAPRYIFTAIAPIARKLFPAADDEVLPYEDQEGYVAEPEAYAPILPIQFINGSTGIGVGFAGRHLAHDVHSVIAAVRDLIDGKSAEAAAKKLKVGVTGFRGKIQADSTNKRRYHVSGVVELYPAGDAISKTSFVGNDYKTHDMSLKQKLILRITELPFGMAIEDYRKGIADKLDNMLATLADNSGANHVDIVLTVDTRAFLSKMPVLTMENILNYLNLANTTSQYMVCIEDGTIKNFVSDAASQLDRFYQNRLDIYAKRLALTQKRLTEECAKLEGHIKFTELVKSEGAKLLSLSEDDLGNILKKANIPLIDGSYKTYTSRSFASLMKDNADTLRAKAEATKEALRLSKENDTPASLWKADLNAFEQSFTAYEKSVTKAIADEYKASYTKRLGKALTMDTIIADAVHLGYNAEKGGWNALRTKIRERRVLNAKIKKHRMKKAAKETKFVKEYNAQMAKVEESLKEADAKFEKAEANSNALKAKKNTTAADFQKLVDIGRVLRSTRLAREKLAKRKAELEDRFRRYFPRRGDAAGTSSSGDASTAITGTGDAATAQAMIAPRAVQLLVMPALADTLTLARLRMHSAAINFSSQGMFRLFGSVLLR